MNKSTFKNIFEIFIITATCGLNSCGIFSPPSPNAPQRTIPYNDRDYCRLVVQFSKISDSTYTVKKAFPSTGNGGGYSSDASSYPYVIEMEYQDQKWRWTVYDYLYGGGLFGGEHAKVYNLNMYCKANTLDCQGCIGTENACNDLLNTLSWKMVSGKFKNDFLINPITKPMINKCEYYVQLENKKIGMQKEQDEATFLKTQQEQNKFNAKLKYDTQNIRTSLHLSDITNCGTVIDIKGNGSTRMVHVQTGSDARDIWIGISHIYPQEVLDKTIGCRDENRWYKKEGQWVYNNQISAHEFISSSYDNVN
ncbi:MAG: hypothetical protein K2P99_04990 [Burkholderiales bacterium]|nr:hypothetical protein [Burkholderiales bacterium]